MNIERRQFLRGITASSIALPWLMHRDGLLADPPSDAIELIKPDLDRVYDLKPKSPARPARAHAMIDLFMFGGPSQMDLCDPKPLLTKRDGEKFDGKLDTDNTAGASGLIFGSPWKFKKYGDCGLDVSELLPHFSTIVDEVCHIRGMHFGTNAHDRGAHLAHSCYPAPGRPTLGSWLTYGLGTENDSLPAFVALTAKTGLPFLNEHNWAAGYLPSLYKGTMVRNEIPRILNLDPPAHLAGRSQKAQLSLLERLNEQHAQAHPAETDLKARIASYSLAARMQESAKEAFDLSNEPESILRMYGVENPVTREYAERCIIARRLVERGVRFVQLLHDGNGDIDWDNHDQIKKNLETACAATDQPVTALVKDLKQRGLLDTTLVRWGGEMGRLPTAEATGGRATWGRDHNGKAGYMWMAGAGMKPGLIHGATDEWGHETIEGHFTAPDFHATVMHLFGLDHQTLVYKHNGVARSMIDGEPARVATELFL